MNDLADADEYRFASGRQTSVRQRSNATETRCDVASDRFPGLRHDVPVGLMEHGGDRALLSR